MHAGGLPVPDDLGPTCGQCGDPRAKPDGRGRRPPASRFVAALRPAIGESNGYLQ
jgi:hypothetical protein